jgi:molybdopterin/thiamine biosynthesis adenylyltransferase
VDQGTSGDTDRFARQRLIDGWDQETLSAATVVIMGVGALGNEAAKNLALAGAGRLILCDPDVIEETNLSRTALFTPADVGQPKVSAAAGAIARMGTTTVADARQATLTAGVGLGELSDAALVLGCLDSVQARVELLGRCALAGATLVDGGTGPWGGEVRIRRSPEQACFACSLSPVQRGESDLPRSCAQVQPPGAEPASIATTALTAAWMTTIALRLLLGLPVPYPVLRIDAELGTTAPVELVRDPACPHHRPLPPPAETLPVSNQQPVSALLAVVPEGGDPLAWSGFPIVAACLRCGHKTDYAGSEFADHPVPLRCGRCGAIQRFRSSNRLAEAARSDRLADIGVAPQEIIPVRLGGGEYQWLRLGASERA